MPRKTKLTPELQEEICKYIEIGVPNKQAALACGISETTFYNWIKRGENTNSGKYFKFLESVKKAQAKNVLRNVAIIEKAAQEKNWQAAAWILERKYPEDWGRKEYHQQDIHLRNTDIIKKWLTEDESNR